MVKPCNQITLLAYGSFGIFSWKRFIQNWPLCYAYSNHTKMQRKHSLVGIKINQYYQLLWKTWLQSFSSQSKEIGKKLTPVKIWLLDNDNSGLSGSNNNEKSCNNTYVVVEITSQYGGTSISLWATTSILLYFFEI